MVRRFRACTRPRWPRLGQAAGTARRPAAAVGRGARRGKTRLARQPDRRLSPTARHAAAAVGADRRRGLSLVSQAGGRIRKARGPRRPGRLYARLDRRRKIARRRPRDGHVGHSGAARRHGERPRGRVARRLSGGQTAGRMAVETARLDSAESGRGAARLVGPAERLDGRPRGPDAGRSQPGDPRGRHPQTPAARRSCSPASGQGVLRRQLDHAVGRPGAVGRMEGAG